MNIFPWSCYYHTTSVRTLPCTTFDNVGCGSETLRTGSQLGRVLVHDEGKHILKEFVLKPAKILAEIYPVSDNVLILFFRKSQSDLPSK